MRARLLLHWVLIFLVFPISCRYHDKGVPGLTEETALSIATTKAQVYLSKEGYKLEDYEVGIRSEHRDKWHFVFSMKNSVLRARREVRGFGRPWHFFVSVDKRTGQAEFEWGM